MTTPLVLKAYNRIHELNQYSYSYLLEWDPLFRKLVLVDDFRKLIPWHFCNIGIVFLCHLCLSIFLIILKTGAHETSSNKDVLQLGALVMMSCHATANCGMNFLMYLHCQGFVHFYNGLLLFEARVRKEYIPSTTVEAASMLKELNPLKLATQEADVLGLIMHGIIQILIVVPAITPISLVFENVDPFGILLHKIFNFEILSWQLKLSFAIARIIILTLAMIEISQTFRTVFIFGMSIFHIYRRCLKFPELTGLHLQHTIPTYRHFQILHTRVLGFLNPLTAFFLGLNFVILVLSTVLCLVSHRILPIQIYAGIPAATAMAYFLLFATLPYAIYCHEETLRLIWEWKRDMKNTRTSLRYWKRVILKLRPISFYCWDLGVLTRQTKRIYMSSIVNSTVNILLWRNGI